MTYFIESLAYCPQDPLTDDNLTYQSLVSEFSPYDDGTGWFDSICRTSAAMAELSYPMHEPEVRLQIARCTWYLVYMDNLGPKFASFVGSFQQHLLKHDGSNERGFLQAYRENLTEFYRFWDIIPANCITLAAMDFMNASLIEQLPCVRNMALSEAAASWPYYLRAKVGASPAFAYMLFPRHLNIDMSVYIQVMADIVLVTDLANDILSFHKECVAGETNNYIHNRAHVTQMSILDTLQDVVDETLAASARISKVLQSTEAFIPWKQYVNGYIAFHITEKRYRLAELGF